MRARVAATGRAPASRGGGQFARRRVEANGPTLCRLATIPISNSPLGTNSNAPSTVTMSLWESPKATPAIPAANATTAGTSSRLRSTAETLAIDVGVPYGRG